MDMFEYITLLYVHVCLNLSVCFLCAFIHDVCVFVHTFEHFFMCALVTRRQKSV